MTPELQRVPLGVSTEMTDMLVWGKYPRLEEEPSARPLGTVPRLSRGWEQCLFLPASLEKTHSSGGRVLREVLPQKWRITSSTLTTARDPLKKTTTQKIYSQRKARELQSYTRIHLFNTKRHNRGMEKQKRLKLRLVENKQKLIENGRYKPYLSGIKRSNQKAEIGRMVLKTSSRRPAGAASGLFFSGLEVHEAHPWTEQPWPGGAQGVSACRAVLAQYTFTVKKMGRPNHRDACSQALHLRLLLTTYTVVLG